MSKLAWMVTPYRRMRIHVEPMLDWQSYKLGNDILIVGTERYPQLVWAITVKPNVLETDPGPLDARVP